MLNTKNPKEKNKILIIASAICVLLAISVLVGGTLTQLSIVQEHRAPLHPNPTENIGYKGATTGHMGASISKFNLEDYGAILLTDGISVATQTTQVGTYPLMRFDYNIRDITDYRNINRIVIRGIGWSRHDFSGNHIQIAIWDNRSGEWYSPHMAYHDKTIQHPDTWSHNQDRHSLLKITIEENDVERYLTPEGYLRIAFRGARNDKDGVPSKMFLDSTYVELYTYIPLEITESPHITGVCNNNGVCEYWLGETHENCPSDCKCDDGICQPWENYLNCPEDCGPEPTQRTLPGQPWPICGDGICEYPLTYENCPEDCSPVICGDGVCEYPLNYVNCPQDCSPICGDGICSPGLTHENCPQDCPIQAYCGDGICSPAIGEDCESCPEDCGDCPILGETVGNNKYLIAGALFAIALLLGLIGYTLKKEQKGTKK